MQKKKLNSNKDNKIKTQSLSFFKRHKSLIIGTGSIMAIMGISIGVTTPFFTKTIDYYVSNKNLKLKGKDSLFFITDGGDIHDGSFNEAAYNEVISISGKYKYEAPSDSNYSSLIHAYNLAASRGASVLEVNGFLHADPLLEFSHNNPDIGIIFLDSELPIASEKKQQGNVASIVFETQQVGFLAGYAASAWAAQNHSKNPNKNSENPLISGVGGLPIPPITSYLAGFELGMNKYNKDNTLGQSNSVKLYIKDILKQPAKYFGGFEPDPQGQVSSYAKQALEAGVDVVFPVGGPQAFTIIREMKTLNASANNIKVLGVDQDLTNQTYAGLEQGGDWTKYVLGSATKGIGHSIASLSNSIFGLHLYNEEPGEYTDKKLAKNVFGGVYKGTLDNNWLQLTGQEKSGGGTETIEELYTSLKIKNKLTEVIEGAKKAAASTSFYGGK